MNPDMTKKIEWREFIDTGMLLYINQILQAFGLSIAYEIDEFDQILDVFPIKTKFRGFDEKNIDKAYYNITRYIIDHTKELRESMNT